MYKSTPFQEFILVESFINQSHLKEFLEHVFLKFFFIHFRNDASVVRILFRTFENKAILFCKEDS